MKNYPVLRYGKLCSIDKKVTINPRTICDQFFSTGWSSITDKLNAQLEKKKAENFIDSYKVDYRKGEESCEECEGLIARYPGSIEINVPLNGENLDLTITLSLTVCKPPHLSKIWVMSTANKSLDSETKIIEFFNLSKALSEIFTAIILEQYNVFFKMLVKTEHTIKIKAIGSSDEQLQSLIDKIRKTKKFSLREKLNQDGIIFKTVKKLISVVHSTHIRDFMQYSELKEKKGIRWLLISTLQNNIGIFSKFHEKSKQETSTVFAGSIYGDSKDAKKITKSILKTVAPYL